MASEHETEAGYWQTLNTVSREQLCTEFMAYCRAQSLPSEGDALDLLYVAITPEQRVWLKDFITRWDRAVADEALPSGRAS